MGPFGGEKEAVRLAGKRRENELDSMLRQAHFGGREARAWIALFRDQDGQSKGSEPELAS